MKLTIFKSAFIILFLFVAAVASAQSAAIYDFSFDIDPVLMDFKKTGVMGIEHSNLEKMPEQLLDSIKIKTEEAFAKKLLNMKM